ncbi:hypothetical protein NQ315_008809 [Exocentrus adspersus]|uniref:Uncharacterized protein n=1 Tax=Exocentrus adspersus TaxID=1586481 RepID=A0AAV8VCK9_9CUCU|nr:hypothetical protein NQ315_008809 [Exocentrus adspersus]
MNPEEEEIIMLLLFATCIGVWCTKRYRLNQRRLRRYAVRPMNRSRRQFGHFANLVNFMKNHDQEQFFKYTRMTPSLFDHLLTLVGSQLQKTQSKNPLSPNQRLTMTLHYLSEGCSMQQIAWDYW